MKIFDRNIIFLSDIWLCYVYMFTQEPVATTAILICMFQADTVSLAFSAFIRGRTTVTDSEKLTYCSVS